MNSSTEYLKIQDIIKESRSAYKGNGTIDIVFMSKDCLCSLKQLEVKDVPKVITSETDFETLWGAKIITTEAINEKYKFVWANQYELEQLLSDPKFEVDENFKRFIPDFKSYLASH